MRDAGYFELAAVMRMEWIEDPDGVLRTLGIVTVRAWETIFTSSVDVTAPLSATS